MAAHGRAGYGSGIHNSVKAAQAEFAAGQHGHHTLCQPSSSTLGHSDKTHSTTSGSGLSGLESKLTGSSSHHNDVVGTTGTTHSTTTGRDEISGSDNLAHKLTGSSATHHTDESATRTSTDRYRNTATETGTDYSGTAADDHSKSSTNEEGGIKGMINKVMGKDDHGNHGKSTNDTY